LPEEKQWAQTREDGIAVFGGGCPRRALGLDTPDFTAFLTPFMVMEFCRKRNNGRKRPIAL
jgi:hypothetical protein